MRRFRMTAIAASAVLILAACSGVGELVDQAEQLSEAIEEQAAAQEGADEGDVQEVTDEAAGGDQNAADVVTIEDRPLNGAVYYGGLEYTVEHLTVVDHDVDPATGEPAEIRMRGVELTFDVTLSNDWSSTQAANIPVALQWDEPSGNVVEVAGSADTRPVPAGASASGAFVINVLPDDLALYDDASARLVLGRSGSAVVQVPVGSEPPLIARYPVAQPHVAGQALELGPVTMTVDEATVRWNHGDTSQPQLDEGEVALVMSFTMANNSDGQVCLARGEGTNFSLVKDTGEGYTDLRVSERCVAGGDTLTVLTGFTIDDDYAGDYSLASEVSVGFDEHSDEMTISLREGGDAGGKEAGETDD